MNAVSNTPEGPAVRTVDLFGRDARQAVAMANAAVREARTPEGRAALAETRAIEVIRAELVRLIAEADALIAAGHQDVNPKGTTS